jgi:hypothetical protein
MKSKNNSLILKKFKKRYKTKINIPTIRWGDISFFFKKRYNFELVYFSFISRTIKRFFLKKRNKRFYRKIWFFFKKNFPITKKSKNARMGKGKGSFLRWIIRLNKNFVFLEMKNINYFLARKICFFLEKKTRLGVNIISKNETFVERLGCNKQIFYIFKKFKLFN